MADELDEGSAHEASHASSGSDDVNQGHAGVQQAHHHSEQHLQGKISFSFHIIGNKMNSDTIKVFLWLLIATPVQGSFKLHLHVGASSKCHLLYELDYYGHISVHDHERKKHFNKHSPSPSARFSRKCPPKVSHM